MGDVGLGGAVSAPATERGTARPLLARSDCHLAPVPHTFGAACWPGRVWGGHLLAAGGLVFNRFARPCAPPHSPSTQQRQERARTTRTRHAPQEQDPLGTTHRKSEPADGLEQHAGELSERFFTPACGGAQHARPRQMETGEAARARLSSVFFHAKDKTDVELLGCFGRRKTHIGGPGDTLAHLVGLQPVAFNKRVRAMQTMFHHLPRAFAVVCGEGDEGLGALRPGELLPASFDARAAFQQPREAGLAPWGAPTTPPLDEKVQANTMAC